jgi:hypothetical protein
MKLFKICLLPSFFAKTVLRDDFLIAKKSMAPSALNYSAATSQDNPFLSEIAL